MAFTGFLSAYPFPTRPIGWFVLLVAAGALIAVGPKLLPKIGIDRHRGRNLFRASAAMVMLGYLASGLTVVGPGEVGLLRRVGAYRPPRLGPGLHLRLPSPLETVTKVEPDLVRSVRVGGDPDESALYLTGDEKLVELSVVVEYHSTEEAAADLEFTVGSIAESVACFAEGALREAASRTSSEALLAEGRGTFEAETEAVLRDRLGSTGLKVALDRLRVVGTGPPHRLAAIEAETATASAEAARSRNEAEAYAAERRWSGRAEAQVRRDNASARGYRLRTRAEGERFAFFVRSEAHALRPDLTEFRLLWDTLAVAYAGRPKLVLDPRVGGRRQLWLAEPSGGSTP